MKASKKGFLAHLSWMLVLSIVSVFSVLSHVVHCVLHLFFVGFLRAPDKFCIVWIFSWVWQAFLKHALWHVGLAMPAGSSSFVVENQTLWELKLCN